MKNRPPDSQFQDALFPFGIRQNLEGLTHRNNQPNLYRIIFLDQGVVLFATGENRQRQTGPALFFLAPGQLHTFTPFRQSRGGQLYFSGGFLDQLLLLCWKNRPIREFIRGVWQQGPLPAGRNPALQPEQHRQVLHQYRQIEAEYTHRRPGFELIIQQALVALFVDLFRSTGRGPATIPMGRQMDDLIEYINTHYAEEFSLASMAEKYAFSPSYFSRRFKERTGMPLFEYINTIRIQKACGLLKRSRESIIEIAYAVGYNNLSFFNRYFRKIMHMSPREYRNHVQR